MIADIVSSKPFVKSPAGGIGVFGAAYYVNAAGGEMVNTLTHMTKSDTTDVSFSRRSQDHGQTWDQPQTIPTTFDDPKGSGKKYPRGIFVDPNTKQSIALWNVAVLPTDDPLEGMRQWTLWYATSNDGAKTWLANEQIIHKGQQYNATNHMPGITVGKNAIMLGDRTQVPIIRHDGVILLPVQISPTGPDGDYHNPGAGYTYTNCMVLMGKWRNDGSVEWTASQPILADPSRTTRGVIEPTIASLNDNRLLLVMRGSNDVKPQWPGCRWYSISNDDGQTWTTPQPWTFSDGATMHSPSSCSQLITHSSGRLFWIGNQCEQNPHGNGPRYPLVMIEIDQATALPIRETLTIVDDRKPGEHERLTLSNFNCREDRRNGQIVVNYPRLFSNFDGKVDFTADLMETRLELR